jgi:hypothetical protein
MSPRTLTAGPTRLSSRGIDRLDVELSRYLDLPLGVHDVPCPICGPTRNAPQNKVRRVLRIWRNRAGSLQAFCIRCGWQGSSGELSFSPRYITRPPARQREFPSGASRLWKQATSIAGSIVGDYLIGRDINLATVPSDVRFHPTCPFGQGENRPVLLLPAMLALMRDIRTNTPRALHRTALRFDGRGKADIPSAKRVWGPAKDTAIKLSPDHAVGPGLTIAEGIETGLTALCLGLGPVWIAHGSAGIAHFPILSGVECLTIVVDHDDSGRAAAARCSERWERAGCETRHIVPRSRGADLNDMVRTRYA